MSHCRFAIKGESFAIISHAKALHIQNSELLCAGWGGLNWGLPAAGQLVIENSLFAGRGVILGLGKDVPANVQVTLRNNTFCTNETLKLELRNKPMLGNAKPFLRIDASHNVFSSASSLVRLMQFPEPMAAEDAKQYVKEMIDWRGKANLYAPGSAWLDFAVKDKVDPAGNHLADLKQWQTFWSEAEASAQEGLPQFTGGDVLRQAGNDVLSVTPTAFRLASNSAGQKAGPDGKDLGADIDLVGPGVAYEKWQRSAEYQDWLSRTGEPAVKAEQK